MSANEKALTVPFENAAEMCSIPCFDRQLVGRLRAEMPGEEALEEAGILLSALADKTRLRILHALKDGQELCVCDVSPVLGATISATSHHLRKLRDLKVLKYRNDGKMAYYSLREPLAARLASVALGGGL